MCNNYTMAQADVLRELAAFSSLTPYPPEAWPAYDAPMILLDQGGGLECVPAKFGFAPPGYARPGMPNPVNVRAEEVTEKPMFATYWRRCQFCIVPAEAVFEPCWETGRNVRHRIRVKDQPVFGIAGLWREWKSPTGGPPVKGFALFTLNAENHAIFKRIHAPLERDGSPKEKRGVVLLRRDQWAAWLACNDPEVARTFLALYPAELMDCEPAPRRLEHTGHARPMHHSRGICSSCEPAPIRTERNSVASIRLEALRSSYARLLNRKSIVGVLPRSRPESFSTTPPASRL